MIDGHFDLSDIPLTSLVCYTGYGFMMHLSAVKSKGNLDRSGWYHSIVARHKEKTEASLGDLRFFMRPNLRRLPLVPLPLIGESPPGPYQDFPRSPVCAG